MFDKDVLKLDPSKEVDRITEALREQVLGQLRAAPSWHIGRHR